MKKFIYLLFIVCCISSCALLNPQNETITDKFFPEYEGLELTTPSINTNKGFTDYDEMMSFINALKSKHPDKINLTYLGESQKGVQIPMVRLTNPNEEEKIKVWTQGGLHGNEPASTEAMLYLMDRLLNDSQYVYLLDKVDLAIVPMANIDGYVKGSRYAANGLDLNRDQTKLMAPESVAIKKAFSDFDPEVAMDFHEYKPYRKAFAQMSTFGITSYYDAMFLYTGNLNVPENLRAMTQSLFVANARKVLDENGFSSHDYLSTGTYSGDTHFNQGSNNARSSATNYALNNTISTLFEIRGVGIGKTSFKRRVQTSFLLGISYLKTAYENASLVKQEIAIAQAVEQDVVATSKKKVYQDTIKAIDLDTQEVIDMEVTIRDASQMESTLSRKRPKAYLIDKNETDLVEKLRALGATVETLDKESSELVERYTVSSYNRKSLKYEGMNLQTVRTTVSAETMTFPAGTYRVPMEQRRANLIAEVLEPEAPNSFVSFGVLKTEQGAILPIYRIKK
jgi:hypothetical protein